MLAISVVLGKLVSKVMEFSGTYQNIPTLIKYVPWGSILKMGKLAKIFDINLVLAEQCQVAVSNLIIQATWCQIIYLYSTLV